MRVRDLMKTDVRCCKPGDSLANAVEQMWSGDCGSLPVVDEHHNVIGMITDRDICIAAWSRNKTLESISVGEVMCSAVTTCEPEDGLQLAQEKMRSRQVRRMPVTEGRRLVGMLTLNDLVLEVIGARGPHAAKLSRDEVVVTLGRICEHGGSAGRTAAE